MKKTMLLIVSLVSAMFMSGCTSVISPKTIEPKSPMVDGFYADPSVIYYNGYFYIYATIDAWGKDELALLKSKDLMNFERLNLNWPTKAACTSSTSSSSAVWAPSVIKGRDDKFYMYVSVGSEVWVGKADHPEGPWHNSLGNKPLIPGDFRKDVHIIDAEAFIDDDGKAYLYWGSGFNWVNGHCLVSRLSDDMCSLVGEVKDITPEGYFEAPFMVKNNAKYYLMYSDGKCTNETYKVRYAIGDNPFGPFRQAENSPILKSNPKKDIYGPGHHSAINYKHQWYIFYHRHSLPFDTKTLKRQICVDKMEFDSQGLIKVITP